MRWSGVLLIFAPAFVLASDHNNVDPGRPLRFEDARSIAFGERAFEFGIFGSRSSRYGAELEIKYGFALNQEIALGFAQDFSRDSTRIGHVELSYLNAIRREIGDSPALAIRLALSSGQGDEGEALIRLIASKAAGQYGRLHLNLDIAPAGHRETAFGAILGYSMPLGYPRRFDQTLVSELSYRRIEGELEGSFGLGLRRQLGPQTTFAIGVLAGFDGDIEFRAGFARSF